MRHIIMETLVAIASVGSVMMVVALSLLCLICLLSSAPNHITWLCFVGAGLSLAVAFAMIEINDWYFAPQRIEVVQ